MALMAPMAPMALMAPIALIAPIQQKLETKVGVQSS